MASLMPKASSTFTQSEKENKSCLAKCKVVWQRVQGMTCASFKKITNWQLIIFSFFLHFSQETSEEQ